MTPTELFENAMDWLRRHYEEYRFFAERDVVWTVQKRIMEAVENAKLPYYVVYNYKIGTIFADLVILNRDKTVEFAAEFKYEPSHYRSDKNGGTILSSKLPVVTWASVREDTCRAKRYVTQHQVKTAYSVLIDEGGYFYKRHRDDAPEKSRWTHWCGDVRVLWSPMP